MFNTVFFLSECPGSFPGVEITHVPGKNVQLKKKKKKATKIFLDLNQILGDILTLLENWPFPVVERAFHFSFYKMLFVSGCFSSLAVFL